MKKLIIIVFLAAATLAFGAGETFAYSFDFAGGFRLEDNDNSGFAETLNLNANPFGKSFIQMFDPNSDVVLDLWSYVLLSEFTLDESAYQSGKSYTFASNPYVDGFQVYNSTGTLLMEADIEPAPIITNGGTATINASFGLNLTNIDIFVSGSPILDAFAPPAAGGAVNFTFNIAGINLATMIETGGGQGSYSASASASAAHLPEPGTVLLLGVGLVGLVGLHRRLKK